MKSMSARPSFRIMCIMPLAKATLVPGLICRCRAASFVRSIFLGSTTISFVPRLTARRIWVPTTGWASVGLEPTRRITSTSPVISAMGLVMAPEPRVMARPVTDAEWQIRAQLSTLLVRKAARIIFWNTKLSSLGAREQEKPAMASLPYLF